MNGTPRLPWVLGASIGMVFIVVAGARVVYESKAEIDAAGAALQVDRPMRAVEHYRRAMRWKLPLSPYASRAAQSLEALALRLEEQGRVDDALLAWRSLAGSASATRWLYGRSDPRVAEATEAVTRLSRTRAREAPSTASVVRPRSEPMQAAKPNALWATCLLVGFAVWVGGLVATASYGFDRVGRLTWSRAKLPLSWSILGFVAFVTGAWLA